MAKWQLIFHIEPTGAFGLPDGERIVVPAGTDLQSPWLHAPTMVKVGHGSLSVYRRQDDAVAVEFRLGNLDVKVSDNIAHVTVEGDDPSSVASAAFESLTRYLRHLSLSNGQLYSYAILVFECIEPARSIYPSVGSQKWFSAIAYDLPKLRQDMVDTLRDYKLSDDRLDRALAYWEHALFLNDNRHRLAEVGSRHYRALAATVLLNLWKAITTIVGDPSSDSSYQSRYRDFGLSYEFFKDGIEKVKHLRDSYDVAHYSLVPKIAELESELQFARETAGEVLRAYRRTLVSAAP